MTTPWDIPPVPEDGDHDIFTTFAAVGRALTEWEHVEGALAQVFSFLVGAEWTTTEPAVRAYGSVVSFQGRANMLDEAAAGYFHTRPNKLFETAFHQVISVECRKFSDRRNDIAHGRVIAGIGKSGRPGYFLTPSLSSTKKWKIGQPARYVYTSKEIEVFIVHFEKLYDRLSRLLQEMMVDAESRASEDKRDEPLDDIPAK